MNTTPRTVLISGAGVAGLALAHWLARHGFTPTVVEYAEGLRSGGYKVDVRGAALTVLDRMGLLDAARALRTEVRTGTIVDGRGKRAASMDADTFGGRVHEDAELLRGDLHRLLHDSARDGVEYLFGDSIAALTDTGEHVEVAFASGRTGRYDLVVGADGLRSATRNLVFGPDDRHLTDLGHYIAVATVPNRLGLDREEMTYIGAGRTALVYSTAREEGARAMFLWRSPALDYRGLDRAGRERLLAEAYAGEGWEVPSLLADTASSPDFLFDSLSQVKMDRWSRGRVVLLGDAAHCASAASGQGTSLALVGAYILAGELAAHAGDHAAAFGAYERRMRPFAETNQALGPANVKRMVMKTKGQVRFSLAMLKLLNKMPGKERMLAKVVEPIHRAANAIDLPEYRIAEGDLRLRK
ncbi:FAD-dependent oxidoreductase [Actinorhabdospora filicis]|uniref:FAD-dependent oxidoreductase n=1 Tax=Actinorhabdospora filicis TaxID=1785913 RepID=A0A9W6SND3_9ACTN|nr:FAD-dependent monooxygenase [Actinorhabdospora filicis]GLZ77756.1 FAD-dependent oxidoreductase [Actinorhabdospora filicis]